MSNLILRNNVLGDLDRMMDAVFGDIGSTRSYSRIPAVDVVETDAGYELKADIPGFAEKDVEIKVDDQLLTISGKHEEAEAKEGKDKSGWLMRERRSASFVRSFTLPTDVEKDHISATVSNGLLTVSLPKTPKAQPRLIDVKRG